MNIPSLLDLGISIGTRVQYAGHLWEITFIDRQLQSVCFRKVNGNETFNFSIGRAVQKFKNKSLVIVRKTPPLTIMALVAATLSANDRLAFERRCAYVKLAKEFEYRAPKKDLLEAVTQLWIQHNELALIEGHPPEEKAPAYTTIKAWQKLVEQSRTLLPLAFTEHRKKPRAKRLSPEVEKLIQEFTQTIFFKNTKTNAIDVHDAVCISIDKLNNEAPPGSHLLAKPCLDTIYKRLELLDPITVDLARKGKDYVRKNYNYGAEQHLPAFIGGLVQCDCHQLDLLVYDDTLGITYRPWLMAFIDGHTRCIVGWELSELAPSAEKAMRCFKNAIAESEGHRYRCVPTRLIFDNGVEFINGSIKAAAGLLLCIIEYGQLRTPNSKSIIERFFRTLNTIIHKLSGTTFSNILERADYDSEGNAIYTLTETRQLLIEFLNYYHLRTHWQLRLSPDTQWRIASDNQEPRIIDAESAATLGTSVRRCSIRSGRVGFDGLYWHSPSLPQLQATLEASNDQAYLHYDESDLAYAWVRHPRIPHEVIRCDPVVPHYQIGLTLKLHKAIRQSKKEYEAATGNPEQARILRAAITAKIINDLESNKTRKTNRARVREYNELISSAKSIDLDLSAFFNPSNHTATTPPPTSTPVDNDIDNTNDQADYSAI